MFESQRDHQVSVRLEMLRSSSQVKTPPFHGGNRGSNPLRSTILTCKKSFSPTDGPYLWYIETIVFPMAV